MQKGSSGAVAAFGSSPPVAPTAAPSPSGPIPVALRLNVAVSAQNMPGVAVERSIFDRISASDRAAGRASSAALAPVSLLPFGTVWNVGANLGSGVIGVGDYSKIDTTSDDPVNVVRRLGVMHRAYYVLRRAVFADAVGQSAPPIVSVRPGISFLGFAPYAAGPIAFGLSMDRAAEGAAPAGGDTGTALAWGVASLYGERLAVGAHTMMSSGNLDTLPFDDSIEMFYIARHGNIAPSVVRTSADVSSLSTSDDAKARLVASIANGASAVVPSSQVGYGGSKDDGWWVLGPDGSVSDEMQSGMHQELPEEGVQVEEEVEEAPQIAKAGGISRCVAAAVGALMGIAAAMGGEGSSEIAENLGELIHAMYEDKEVVEVLETANQCK